MSFDKFYRSIMRAGRAGGPTLEEARADYASLRGCGLPPFASERTDGRRPRDVAASVRPTASRDSKSPTAP